MKEKIRLIALLFLSLALLAALGGVFWQTWRFAEAYPGGSAFARHWMAVRAFIYGNGNPYAAEVARAAQTLLTGSSEFTFAPRVDEPFYLLLFYIPFASAASYPLARGLWMLAAWLALAGSVLLGVSLTTWRPRRGFLGLFLLFGLFWPHSLQVIVLGSNVVWQLFWLLAGLLALRSKSDELAGSFFLLAAFRWQAVLPFYLTLTIWLVSLRRWRVFAGFGMALVFLTGVSVVLKGNWLLPWLQAAYYNLNHVPALTVRSVLTAWWPAIGQKVGWGVQILVALTLLIEWALVRRRSFRHLLWTASLALALAPLLGLPVLTESYALLLLPLTLVLSIFDERWQIGGRWLILFLTVVLLAGGWALFWALHQGWVGGNALFFPLPLLTVFGLYWTRWWAVRTPVATVDGFERLIEYDVV